VKAAEKIPIVETRFDENLSGIIANYVGTISCRGKKKKRKKLSINMTLKDK
jgi:hypothetical protein